MIEIQTLSDVFLLTHVFLEFGDLVIGEIGCFLNFLLNFIEFIHVNNGSG